MARINHLRPITIAIALWLAVGAFPGWPAYTADAHHGVSLQVSPAQAAPGESVTITGSGFPSRSIIVITLESDHGIEVLTEVEATAAGELQTDIVVPSQVAAGSWDLVAVGGDEKVVTDFTVQGGGPDPHATPTVVNGTPGGSTMLVFQRTNTETIIIGIIIATLILTGAVLILVGTRRSRVT